MSNLNKRVRARARFLSNYLSTTALMWLLSATPSFAQGKLTNPLEADTLRQFIADILEAVVFILTPVIVLMVIYAGFLFVIARGNNDKLTKAKHTLLYVVIGAAVILGAQILADVIAGTVTDITAGTDI